MKRIFALLIAAATVVCCLSFVSCSEADPEVPEGYKLLSPEGGDYSMCCPDIWVVERCDAGMTSVYVSEADFTNVSVCAFTLSSASDYQFTTLRKYIEEYYFKQFSDNFNNLEYSRAGDGSANLEAVKVDERDALTAEFSATVSGEKYMFKVAFICENGCIYTIQFTARGEAKFSEHIAKYDAMLGYFKFKG